MSVAAALALARQQVPRIHTAPTHPRAEAAAIALNGLESLSSIDPVLSTLAAPLLLLTPHRDRTTLPLPDAEALSAASVVLIRRLAPVLPLRHSQKVLQWLLHHLQLGVAGEEREVDALLVAALPFHATPEFVGIVTEGLRKERRKWKWLEVVIKQRKPANVEFMRKGCSMNTVWMVVEEAVRAVNEGINVKPLAGFLASVVVWKVGELEERERRYAVLRLVKAMEELKGKKGRDTEVICALMMCLAIAVEKGVDEEVRVAAGRVVALAMAKGVATVRETATECLKLFVEQGLKVIPRDVAKVALKAGCLVEGTEGVCEACVMGMLEGKVGVKMIEGITNGTGHLGLQGVKSVVLRLLDLFTSVEKGDWEEEEVKEKLAGVLSSMAKGRFAEGVDEALRMHFAKRKSKNAERYKFIDSVLVEALAGSSYEVLKKNVGKKVAAGTVSGMLVHPEPVVRIAALQRIKENDRVRKKGNTGGALSKKCLDLVRDDPDVSVAAIAADCLLLLHDGESLVDVRVESIVTRYRAERLALQRIKKKKKPRRVSVDALARQVIFACQRYLAEDSLRVRALLIGLFVEEDFGEQVTRIRLVDEVKSILQTASSGTELESVELDGNDDLCNLLKASLCSKISTIGHNCLPLIKALSSWDAVWAVSVLNLWLNHLTHEKYHHNHALGRALLEAIRYLYDQDARNRALVSGLVERAVIPICKTSQGRERKLIADQLWHVTTRVADADVFANVLKDMSASIGLANSIKVLNRAVTTSPAEHKGSSLKSLAWFMAMSESHPSEEIQKQAVYTALCVLYGNDGSLRNEIKSLCNMDLQIPVRKEGPDIVRRLRCCIKDIADLDRLDDSQYSKDRGEAGTDLASVTLLSLRLRNRHPPSLLESSFVETACADILQWTLERICAEESGDNERVFLLRAVQGAKEIGKAQADRLLRLLRGALDADIQPNAQAELVFRLSSLVTTHGVITKLHTSLDKSSVLQSVQCFATKLEAMERGSLSHESTLPELQHAIVLATGQFFNLYGSRGGAGTDSHQLLFGLLLAVSVKSSSGGIFARRVLDEIYLDHFEYVFPFIDRFVTEQNSKVKKQRIIKTKTKKVAERVPVAAGLGAIETLGRLVTSSATCLFEKWRSTLHEIMSSLWNFIANVMSKLVGDSDFLENNVEYQLQTVMSVLSSLHRKEAEMRNEGELFHECNYSALTSAIFYGGLAGGESQTALRLAVGKASLELAGVLSISQGAALSLVLANNVDKAIMSETPLSPHFLHSLVIILVRSGCDFRKICSWISRTALRSVDKTGISSEHRQLIASCCQLPDDKQVASVVCLQEFSRQAMEHLPSPVVAQECAHLLVRIGLSVISDLTVITEVDNNIRCELASFYLLHAEFQAKLHNTVVNSDKEDDMLISGFSRLYQALLQASKTHDDESIVIVLGLVPLSVLTVCIVDSIKEFRSPTARLSLMALLARLKAHDVQLSCIWNFDEVDTAFDSSEQSRSMAASFASIGNELCNIVKSQVSESNGHEPDGHKSARLAFDCLDVLIERAGSSSQESILKFSGVPLSIIKGRRDDETTSDSNTDEQESTLVSTALRCMATIIRILGKPSVVFVPQTVGAAVNVLQSSFMNNKRSSAVTALVDAAALVCNTVLEKVPKLFGRVAVQNIAKLVLSNNNTRVCNDILQLAMQRVPTSVSLASLHAVAQKFLDMRVTVRGMVMLLTALSVMVESTPKTECRAQIEQFVRIGLTCVEFSSGEENQSQNLVVSEANTEHSAKRCARRDASLQIDNAFTDTMMKIVLKIPETDFKELFKRIIQWVDGGRLPESLLDGTDSHEKEVPQNALRAIPFFRLSRRLLQVLQVLYVPYFFQLLDQVLDVIGGGRKYSLSGVSPAEEDSEEIVLKKRKRSQLEGEDKAEAHEMLSVMKEELYEVALENLILFLQQELNSAMVTPAVVSKIQGSLLDAFDKEGDGSKGVVSAFVAVGSKIVNVGSQKESREESRDLLVSLSRDVLSRTRHAEAKVRKASLTVCKSVAMAIGDEYLVTLPESMPVLSEVIDDEDSEVRSEAKAFVQVMESLAGESIMENLI